VQIVSTKGAKAKIATTRGLRWAHLRDLVTTPETAMTPAAAAHARTGDALGQACTAIPDERIPQ